ncbi:MAG: hypothetical protein IPK26_04765 [Planctomycetes bacterium]|nr:hypothetical protein [Planctomycetota bacterium]
MRQHSLFPDDYEVIEQALAALRRLDVDEALTKVRLARARDTRLADLAALEEALVWLARQTLHDQAGIARTLLAVGEAFAARELGEVAAGVVDDAIAHVFAADTGDSPFLDPANRVPRALLDLLGRRHSKAHGRLRELVLAWPDRGDLWCWYGNACLGAERQAEARAAWVRALLLAPDRFDWWRIADRQLRTVRDDCLADAPAGDGGLTLAVAWRRGLLPIPARNDWLSHAQIARLSTTTAVDEHASVAARHRRFCLLLYLDRSLGGATDVDRRLAMADLAPAEFQQFMAACRQREQGRGAGGGG